MIGLVLGPAVLALLLSGGPASHAVDPDEARISAILRQKVDEDRRMPGIALALVDASGIRTFHHGVACKGGAPVSAETVFETGSLTKPVTEALMMRLEAAGKVKSSDTVTMLLAPRHRLESDAFGAVTLRQLANHTSGLPRMPDDLENPADYSAARAYAFLARAKPANAGPGERLYSNFGYGLLGHLLELRTGQPYPALVARYITKPLGMKSATFDAPQRNGACGHDEALDPVEPTTLGPILAPAGGLKASVYDMARFLRASIGSGKGPAMKWGRLQDVRGLALISHDGSTDGFFSFMTFDPAAGRGVVVLSNSRYDIRDVALHLMQPAFPLVPRRVAVDHAGVDLEHLPGRYEEQGGGRFEIASYGHRLLMIREGQPMREVFAEAPGRLFTDDAHPLTVEIEGAATKLSVYSRDGAAGKATRRSAPTATFLPLNAADATRLAGRYRLPEGDELLVTSKDGTLYAQLTGQGTLEVLPLSPTELVYRDVAAVLQFAPGDPSPSMAIVQGGNRTPGQRIAEP